MGFVAQLFNTCPCLHITKEEVEAVQLDLSSLEIDDAGDSRGMVLFASDS